jgi:hypothetical protein
MKEFGQTVMVRPEFAILNGTFRSGKRLSLEDQLSNPFELWAQDVLELGIDILR